MKTILDSYTHQNDWLASKRKCAAVLNSKPSPAVLTFSGQEGEQVRSRRRHWLNHFAKFLPLVLLAVPLLLAAQAFQESNGIIDMDGERYHCSPGRLVQPKGE